MILSVSMSLLDRSSFAADRDLIDAPEAPANVRAGLAGCNGNRGAAAGLPRDTCNSWIIPSCGRATAAVINHGSERHQTVASSA